MTPDPGGSSTIQARPGTTSDLRRAWRTTLLAVRQAAGLARRATRDTLTAWGISHMEETATLLVSELVGNAVRHASGGKLALALRLETSGTRLRIEVLDSDPQPPQPRTPAQLDESGYGFVLVEALSSAWGVRQTATGKAVWAELDIRGLVPAEQANEVTTTERTEQ
jgi:anti-sigma regulatory factor (Ser/Thr protein kinase)